MTVAGAEPLQARAFQRLWGSEGTAVNAVYLRNDEQSTRSSCWRCARTRPLHPRGREDVRLRHPRHRLPAKGLDGVYADLSARACGSSRSGVYTRLANLTVSEAIMIARQMPVA